MHYLSRTVYVYILWCEHVVNRGQEFFGDLLYVGSKCNYFLIIIIIIIIKIIIIIMIIILLLIIIIIIIIIIM